MTIWETFFTTHNSNKSCRTWKKTAESYGNLPTWANTTHIMLEAKNKCYIEKPLGGMFARCAHGALPF